MIRALRLIFVLALIAGPALGADLHGARAAGQIGEKPDGYVAAIQHTPEIDSLVTSVNAQRQSEYARISKEKNQPIDVVAKLAAQEIIQKLSPGEKYQAPDGSWTTR